MIMIQGVFQRMASRSNPTHEKATTLLLSVVKGHFVFYRCWFWGIKGTYLELWMRRSLLRGCKLSLFCPFHKLLLWLPSVVNSVFSTGTCRLSRTERSAAIPSPAKRKITLVWERKLKLIRNIAHLQIMFKMLKSRSVYRQQITVMRLVWLSLPLT